MTKSIWIGLCVPLAVSALACGGSAPPAAGAPAPESSAAGAASAAPTTEAADAKPDADKEAKKEENAPAEKKAADGGGPGGTVGAASVDQKPLGGQLTQNEIRAIVEQHGEFFNDCYTLGAGKSQQFIAKVTLKVTLGPTGNVNEALVKDSTAKNPKVDQCVVDGFKKIKFPAPKSGATSVFTFPMQFNGAVEIKK